MTVNADLGRFLGAIRRQESSGYYQVVNPNSGALGAYQVMPGNLPGWLAQSGLPPMTPYQYLHDPAAQDQLAATILGGYARQYGYPGAAAMWYSGQPDPTKTYGDPPVYIYVEDVMTFYEENAGGQVNYGTAPGGADFNLPPPNTSDWSPTVRGTARVLQLAGGQLHNDAVAISRMR